MPRDMVWSFPGINRLPNAEILGPSHAGGATPHFHPVPQTRGSFRMLLLSRDRLIAEARAARIAPSTSATVSAFCPTNRKISPHNDAPIDHAPAPPPYALALARKKPKPIIAKL
jgi:hypothetical protein